MAHRHGGDSIFAGKKSPKINWFVKTDIGLVWELLAPGYGLLTAHKHTYSCIYVFRDLWSCVSMFSLKNVYIIFS